MNILAIIRLCIWCVVITITLAIVILNYSISQIVNDPSKLQSIARQAETYEVIREDILTPRILKEAQDAGYDELVDEASVQQAVDTAFDDKNLNQLLIPATESMANWLANKQPDAEFTVDASKQLTILTDVLAAEITANILEQPSCTFANTLGDAAVGRCRVASLSEQEIRRGIITALQAQEYIRDGELSSDQLAVPNTLISQTRNLPAYLNILNSAAIFAAGIFALSSLWLIFKHRFRGLLTVSIGGLLATLVIYCGQFVAITSIHSLTFEAGYQEVVRTLTRITANELRNTLWPVAGISTLFIAIGLLGVIVTRRRSTKSQHKVHFHETTEELKE